MKFLLLLTFLLSCAPVKLQKGNQASTQSDWTEANKAAIQQYLKQLTLTSKQKKIAVFDWDNTMIKNDIGDAMIFWMLANNKIKNPKTWAGSSSLLSESALQALVAHCPLSSNVEFVATKNNSDCSEIILQIYTDGKLATGENAWRETFNRDWMEPAYAWAVQLAQGYTPSELRAMANVVIDQFSNNPIGQKLTLGKRQIDHWLQLYQPMKKLVSDLLDHGFDVWISSASSQYIVEEFARHVGLSNNRVIGVRPVLDKENRITTQFEGCGPTPAKQNLLINYRQGKRCWINKIIFAEKDKQKQIDQPSPTHFAAGDSDTDMFFVRDAKEFHVVINRQKPEIMCHALAFSQGLKEKMGTWIINPMFIAPKSKKSSPYECQKFGFPNQLE